MKNNYLKLPIMAVCFLMLHSPLAMAHKIRVFAYEDNGLIIAEAAFNNGRPVMNSNVTIETTDGTALLSGVTDTSGIFRFKPPVEAVDRKLDVKIVVDVGEGHQGYWLLRAADYLDAADITPKVVSGLASSKDTMSSPLPASLSTSGQCGDIELKIEQIVTRELAPIKRMLAEQQSRKVSLQDILGGIGYILGIAGIAMYFQTKKSGDIQ